MRICGAVALGLALAMAATGAQARYMSDAQVRQQIIREAIASYRGACPCPYSMTGKAPKRRRCGSSSEYSRQGANIQCYPRDIDNDGVDAWRSEHSHSR